MKRKIFYLMGLLLTLAFSSCSNEETPIEFEQTSNFNLKNLVSSNIRSVDEAINIAEQATSVVSKTSRSPRIVDAHSVKVIKSKESRGNASDTLIYIINYENETGYAIINARRDLEPLLAVTSKGSIQNVENIANPGVAMYLEAAVNYASDYEIDTIIRPPLYQIRTETIRDTTKILPHVQVAWGQNFPTGMYCPNGVSGCLVTATAQALTYISVPLSITLTYPGHTQSSTMLSWYYMPAYVRALNYEPFDGPNSYEIQLANFCAELGYKISTRYITDTNPPMSSSTIENLRNGLAQNYITGNGRISSVRTGNPNLAFMSDGIIIMRGTSAGAPYGHAWLIDGYTSITTITRTYLNTNPIPALGDWELIEENTVHQTFCHINWGERGVDDGYFNYGVYDGPSSPNYTEGLKYFIITKFTHNDLN